eukprot:7388855-Prymnesium_polylepis.1
MRSPTSSAYAPYAAPAAPSGAGTAALLGMPPPPPGDPQAARRSFGTVPATGACPPRCGLTGACPPTLRIDRACPPRCGQPLLALLDGRLDKVGQIDDEDPTERCRQWKTSECDTIVIM